MIEFCQVSASYDGELAILRDVSFTVSDGDFVAFVGTNGAGKSTTMRLINGLLKPTLGEVLIDGVPTSQLKTSELASKVGFLFQNPDRQICCKTVREELLFGFAAQGRAGAEAEAKVDAMIERFGFDGDAEPFLLNRGTRQLLALASIIVLEPPIVVLDEPTAELDPASSVAVFDLLKRYSVEHGTTVIVVEQKIALLSEYADTLVIVDEGEIRFCGTPHEVLEHSDELLEIGVNCPRSTSLVNRLRARGLVCGPAVCTVEGAVCACEGLLSGKGACA